MPIRESILQPTPNAGDIIILERGRVSGAHDTKENQCAVPPRTEDGVVRDDWTSIILGRRGHRSKGG